MASAKNDCQATPGEDCSTHYAHRRRPKFWEMAHLKLQTPAFLQKHFQVVKLLQVGAGRIPEMKPILPARFGFATVSFKENQITPADLTCDRGGMSARDRSVGG